jgi:RNA polymerase sigma factor (TIGR02999 family)
MSDITEILQCGPDGDSQKVKALFPLVYEELHKLARMQMAHQPADHTLQPTALVHEAWLRLVDVKAQSWENRSCFYSTAAIAMRCILVEHARRKSRLKRGGDRQRLDIDMLDLAEMEPDEKILQVDEALNHFEKVHPQEAKIVMLKYFGGLTNKEVADTLGISERSVDRRWLYAKTWLFKRIRSELH